MGLYHRIVATAGTSALTRPNAPRLWLDAHGHGLMEWERARPVPRGPDAVAELLRRWRDNVPPGVDPLAVSAEYSILHALRCQRRLGPRPTVVLVHTGTPDGVLAAGMVRPLLERDFDAHVEMRKVGDLDAERPALMRRGLGAFMQQVADALRAGDRYSTCFASLGGYKVMTSLGYVAGAFLQFPTLYLHENSQLPHEVPWVPIQIDRTELARLAPVVRKAVGGVLSSALSGEERRHVEEHTWLFERVDVDGEELVLLNAFGHFLRRDPRYRGVAGPRVRVGAGPRRTLDDGARRGFTASQVNALLAELEDPARNRATLQHEVDFDIRSAEWHLYKGASGPAGVFRAVYRWDEATDTVDLREAWFNHDEYEARAGRRETYATRDDELVDVTGHLYGG